MTNFDAKQARQIVDSLHANELDTILENIKIEAQKGKSVLHIYENLDFKTKQVLMEKGFSVIDAPSISIQKDGLYCSIYWK